MFLKRMVDVGSIGPPFIEEWHIPCTTGQLKALSNQL